jgi:uncharacterized protein (DUF983 family)
MNRRDLVDSATKAAFERLHELEEKYTCPKCRNAYLFDPTIQRCEACGYKLSSWFSRLCRWLLWRS